MTDQISAFIAARRRADAAERVVPALRFADGSTLSVQASDFHYCTPKSNFGPWSSFEVGPADHRVFPELRGHREAPKDSSAIHSYVPRSVVDAVAKRKGGLVFPA